MKQKPPFDNIEPMPNPKNLTVKRVQVRVSSEDGKLGQSETAFIRNVSIHPARAIRG